jgi:hypothetical protein
MGKGITIRRTSKRNVKGIQEEGRRLTYERNKERGLGMKIGNKQSSVEF